MDPLIYVIEDVTFIKSLAKTIEEMSNNILKNNNTFTVGLSGGSLITITENAFKLVNTDWNKWRFIFCDERVVPHDDVDSNGGTVKKGLEFLNLSDDQFIMINPALSANDAAIDYENKLKEIYKSELPDIDLLLLGMGPDGHTCSLFPGHPLLEEKKLWVAPIANSPKPPKERITLTLPVINNAKNVMFPLSGKGKAEVLKKIFVDKEDLPVGRVRLAKGICIFYLDTAAASYLPESIADKFKS